MALLTFLMCMTTTKLFPQSCFCYISTFAIYEWDVYFENTQKAVREVFVFCRKSTLGPRHSLINAEGRHRISIESAGWDLSPLVYFSLE